MGARQNLAKCDLSNAGDLRNADCTGCNLGNANLSNANATGARLRGANLSKACLVDANLRGADLTNVNTKAAIFCRTVMPDSSINNDGCANATACCPTCNVPRGERCGDPGAICCSGACRNGICGCPVDQTECNGRCVDLQTDPANCGRCRVACGTGEICDGGQCGVPCGAGFCPAAGATPECCIGGCVDIQTDAANCGACGNQCRGGLRCQNGACICDRVSCPTGICRVSSLGPPCCCPDPRYLCVNRGTQTFCQFLE